jgi:hypothetical protein
MMTISNTHCTLRKANNGSPYTATGLSPVELYAVRALARRAGISFTHAMIIAELAGIIRESAHE